MLTEWRLGNFKAVRERTTLELRPVTVLAGANSSGKSTVIQSILMIAQTLSSRLGSRSVVLNGSLVRLGQFDDLRSKGTDSRAAIHVGWEYRPQHKFDALSDDEFDDFYFLDERIKTIGCDVDFAAGSNPVQPRLRRSVVKASWNSQGMGPDSTGRIELSRVGDPQRRIDELELSRSLPPTRKPILEYRVRLDPDSRKELIGDTTQSELVSASRSHFLPSNIWVLIDRAEQQARALVATLVREQRHARRPWGFDAEYGESPVPEEVVAYLRTIVDRKALHALTETSRQSGDDDAPLTIRDLEAGFWNANRTMPRQEWSGFAYDLRQHEDEIFKLAMNSYLSDRDLVASPLPESLREAVWILERIFSTSIKYLGPLRDEPKALYPLPSTGDPSDVGLKGEFTAATYDLNKLRRIRYVPAMSFREPTVSRHLVEASLEEAVNDWLSYLEIARGIRTVDRGKLGHEMTVVTFDEEEEHDLTHVGVGVSQVLPILVMSLLADSDSLLLFEQPEIHLHPRVQSRLADFFVSLGMSNKQCLIETHSDHFVNQLRWRIVEAETPEILSLLKLYFVQRVGGSSSFSEVQINEFGAIPNWPDGFFDQSSVDADRILFAASKKRQTRAGR